LNRLPGGDKREKGTQRIARTSCVWIVQKKKEPGSKSSGGGWEEEGVVPWETKKITEHRRTKKECRAVKDDTQGKGDRPSPRVKKKNQGKDKKEGQRKKKKKKKHQWARSMKNRRSTRKSNRASDASWVYSGDHNVKKRHYGSPKEVKEKERIPGRQTTRTGRSLHGGPLKTCPKGREGGSYRGKKSVTHGEGKKEKKNREEEDFTKAPPLRSKRGGKW